MDYKRGEEKKVVRGARDLLLGGRGDGILRSKTNMLHTAGNNVADLHVGFVSRQHTWKDLCVISVRRISLLCHLTARTL